MALYKRGNTWWVRLCHKGQRIQESTGTTDKMGAQRIHDELKASLWRTEYLKEKPQYKWVDAVIRWLKEAQHKRSLQDDKGHLRWLDPHLKHSLLRDITRDKVDQLAQLKEQSGVKPATVNRMLALIRSILRKAEREWEWIDRAPVIRLRCEDKGRIRWLTPDEVKRLLKELPPHLQEIVRFTLATGLRKSNVIGLEWENIDLVNRHAWIHPDQAKANKALPVPLNQAAMALLEKRKGKHPQFVFSYRHQGLRECNTKAWRKALQRAQIDNFRWHDLRHTWASWHVQQGTTLQELQQLGGWASYEMVLRYAHLSSTHLQKAAEKISATNLLHSSEDY